MVVLHIAMNDDGFIIFRVSVPAGFLGARKRALLEAHQLIMLLVDLSVEEVECHSCYKRQNGHSVIFNCAGRIPKKKKLVRQFSARERYAETMSRQEPINLRSVIPSVMAKQI